MTDVSVLNRIRAFCLSTTAAPRKGSPGNPIKLTRKQFNEWDGKSYREQVQYLEEHPDSIFHQVGITKRKTRGKSKKNQEQEEEQNKPAPDEEAPAEEAPAEEAPATEENQQETAENPENAAPETEPAPESEGNSDDGAAPAPEGEAQPSEDGSDKETSEDGGPELATEFKELDESGKQDAAENINALSEDGALEAGSEAREQVAATVEAQAETLSEQLDPDDVAEVDEGYEDAKAEAKTGMFSPRTKKILAIAGLMAFAAVAGVGLFYVNPVVAMHFGQMMAQNLGTFAEAIVGDDKETNASAGGLQAMTQDVAEYMRRGDLPEDFLEAARLAVGVPHDKA